MKNETETNNASKTNEEDATNLQTIVVIGHCKGDYHNQDVTKEFSGKMLAMVRPNGSLIVQNLNAGIRPICYIGEGAEISLARDVIDADIELMATTDDGQQLTLRFDEVYSLCGVPGVQDVDSLALTILRVVSDLDGRYGRVRIARLLTGSTSKCVLTMGLDELRTYGIARSVSQKEMLHLIDWLLEEGYLEYSAEEQYPTLTVSEKGKETISGVKDGAESSLGRINTVCDGEEINEKIAKLKDWRKAKAEEMDQNLYIVLQNRTIEELAVKNPGSVEDLLEIYGISDVRAERFGGELLGILNEGVL